jgi:serine/threonine protein kinase
VTRTPRRSIDARRFPVSMHYANGFEPDVLDYDSKRESQHSLNFAEMVRARQSLDLDDVMPFNMAEAGEKSVPPVPPLPSKAFLTQNKVKADFPESVWHLSSQLRAEKATEVFGDLVIIGEGESGNVYSTIPREGCPVPSVKGRGKVAVKVVSFAAPGGGKESADRFEKLDKETALWRQSHLHRNIVTLYDVFVSPQEEQYPGVWVVQEFMSMSLADLIGLKASGLHITEPHMARILLDGVLALEHLHYQNIIHRDVRSDNLLLTFDGVAKLTDFTHATRMEKDKKENCVVGTAYWMAPEVVKAEDYTSKVDIWSLGVVLYELVEGDPPRVDFPALRAITLTAKLGLPALSQPHLHSSALRHCLAWCTEMDPEKRPSADMLPHVSVNADCQVLVHF